VLYAMGRDGDLPAPIASVLAGRRTP